MTASLAIAAQLWRSEEARERLRYEAEAAAAMSALESRMDAQIALLLGARGFLAASSDVTPQEFSVFTDRLGLAHRYPGVLGIGYAVFAPNEAALRRIERRARASGRAGFRHWPAGESDGYSTIVLLEPGNERNDAAMGFDMTSEPVRRAAMIRARMTGEAALTGIVSLVQEIDDQKQPGFLIYLPVFSGPEEAAADADTRARQLRGWIYSPLRAHDLLRTVFRSDAARPLDIVIYDQAVGPERLLYRTAPEAEAEYRRQFPVTVAGREWIVDIASTDIFERSGSWKIAAATALAGFVISLLLAALASLQARAAAAAEDARELLEQRVGQRTAELSAANVRLMNEAKSREVAEAQVRQMQKMEAIGQVTGGVAHDFNNMLAIIMGSLELARRRLAGGDTKKVERFLANAEEGAARAAELTQRLLAFARRQPLHPQPLDPNRLLQGMIELLRRTLGERMEIRTLLKDGVWPICSDPSQLENALLNLAVNARDAMPDGGTLRIETHNRNRIPAPSGGGGLQGDFVEIRVSDTGTGMPPEVAERVFEPFYTTKRHGSGTGLGLSQVYGFVKQSDGYVYIDSTPGQGTIVSVLLPRWHGEVETRQTGTAEVERDFIPGRVLVVEDEAAVRRVSVESLTDLGFEVAEAANGQEALDRLTEDPGFDLLFSDVVMPKMTGVQLAAEARRLNPDLPILLTTGYARDAMADASADLDLPVLSKPFTGAQLAEQVEKVLSRRNRRG